MLRQVYATVALVAFDRVQGVLKHMAGIMSLLPVVLLLGVGYALSRFKLRGNLGATQDDKDEGSGPGPEGQREGFLMGATLAGVNVALLGSWSGLIAAGALRSGAAFFFFPNSFAPRVILRTCSCTRSAFAERAVCKPCRRGRVLLGGGQRYHGVVCIADLCAAAIPAQYARRQRRPHEAGRAPICSPRARGARRACHPQSCAQAC